MPTAVNSDVARTVALLGGAETIHSAVTTGLQAHDLISVGLPPAALMHLTKHVGFLGQAGALEKAVGISVRTLQRRKKDADGSLLSVEQSNRTWKFAEILGRATEVFGTPEEAEAWLLRPAFGLDRRKPIDLLATSLGTAEVETYLTRIEYGVYT